MEEYQVAFDALHKMLEESGQHSDYDLMEAFIKKEKLRRKLENDN